jgi:hypothetical protein
MASLATKIKEAQWLDTNMKNDRQIHLIRTFFLSGKHRREDLTCSAPSCVIPTALQSSQPMSFCFSCNRTTHLACLGLNLQSFAVQEAPFMCQECVGNPSNNFAADFYASAVWGNGIIPRRKALFKPESLTKYPKLLDDQKADLSWEAEDIQAIQSLKSEDKKTLESIPRALLDQQKEEMTRLGDRFQSYKENSEKEIADLRQKLAEAEKLKIEESKSETFFSAHMTSDSSTETCQVTTCESILKKLFVSSQPRPESSAKAEAKRGANDSTWDRSDFNLPNLDESQLTTAEKILLSSTKAHIENACAQRDSTASRKLELKRKALPKIASFKGDPRGWITFIKEVTRYREVGCYDDELVKFYVYGALEGAAQQRVEDMIDTSTLDEILKVLETSFGHSPTIIKAIEEEILKVRFTGDLIRDDVVRINSLIQTYFTTCRYAKVARLNSNMLADHVLNQLEVTHRIMFRQHCRSERPKDEVLMPDLDVLYSFFESIASSLDVKPKEKEIKDKKEKPAQLHSISATSTSSHGQDYLFQIRDVATAIHQGYNMASVNSLSKKCFCCDRSNHFTIECYKFRSMTDSQRSQLITDKAVCRNCLLTNNHRADQCIIKPGCGRKISENSFCSDKHHAVFHGLSGPNSNHQDAQFNTGIINSQPAAPVASTIADQSPASAKPSNVNLITNPSRLIYSVTAPLQQQSISSSVSRTIKVFRHRFFGPHGETTAYTAGDSGSEITIIRDDLRQALGIEGRRTTLEMQWTDNVVRSVPALEVSLQIKGLGDHDELITLTNCYALDSNFFSLPPRSLDVDAMKQQFPYLREAKFESYTEAIPSLLIGSQHAACIEAVAPALQGGNNKPVAIQTRIGWSVYGGAPEKIAAEGSKFSGSIALRAPQCQKEFVSAPLRKQLMQLILVITIFICASTHRVMTLLARQFGTGFISRKSTPSLSVSTYPYAKFFSNCLRNFAAATRNWKRDQWNDIIKFHRELDQEARSSNNNRHSSFL